MAQSRSLCSEIETLSHVLSLMETFRAFDSDNDGLITCAELGGILSSLGYNKASEQDVRAMMQQGDIDKDGLLSLDEFLEMNAKNMDLGEVGSLLRSAFEYVGEDNNEIINGKELHDIMKNLGVGGLSLDNCNDIIASIDADGDGAVSLEDIQLITDCLL